jgi:LPS-assembly lipoprotein
MIRHALIALALAPLAACGFTPVYGGGQGASFANTGPISISEIRMTSSTGASNGRTGHFLRQELVRTVGQGVPGYTSGSLEINLSQSIERLAFAPDQAASRSDYVGNAVWILRNAGGAVIGTGAVKERASFNFADAAYADLAAQTAAQERLATLLARSIRSEMISAAGRPVEAAAPAPPPPTTPATALPGVSTTRQ